MTSERFQVELLCRFYDSKVSILLEKVTDKELLRSKFNVVVRSIFPLEVVGIPVSEFDTRYMPTISEFSEFDAAYYCFGINVCKHVNSICTIN